MAKKLSAKTQPSPAPSAAPVPAQRAAKSSRPPAGRVNKAAPIARDATETPAAAVTPVPSDPAAVTAPPKKKAAPKSSRTSAKLPASSLPPSTPPPKPALAPNSPATPKLKTKAKVQPAPPETSTPDPVTVPQSATNTLLNLAAKAVKLVGSKAAKLKKEVHETAAVNYAARRAATPREISQEEIAIRAYLIAEKRQQHGIHAEPHEDWVEAEKQLRAEISE